MSTARPLKVKLELRAITNSDLKRESAVMISSTIPSAKYSCSRSSLMLWNGRTAMEGSSGSGQRNSKHGGLATRLRVLNTAPGGPIGLHSGDTTADGINTV